jgi:Putative prokaryotic signal transducing protein
MKKVFVSQNLVEVEMRREWLEQAGIRCTIKNQRVSGLAGEIPFAETFPELWVLHDDDCDRARELLEEAGALPESKQDSWICPGCGEPHESQFGICWKCGREKEPT